MRFLPIESVCRANLDDIRKASQAICLPAFPSDKDAAALKFAVQYEHRASVSINRADVIDAVVEGIPQVSKATCAYGLHPTFCRILHAQEYGYVSLANHLSNVCHACASDVHVKIATAYLCILTRSIDTRVGHFRLTCML